MKTTEPDPIKGFRKFTQTMPIARKLRYQEERSVNIIPIRGTVCATARTESTNKLNYLEEHRNDATTNHGIAHGTIRGAPMAQSTPQCRKHGQTI